VNVAHVSASIMCGRLGALAADVRELEDANVDSIHIDIMDGHFVPNLTFGPDVVRAIREATRLPLHVHMMVTNPDAHVDRFAEAGADIFLFHIEASRYPIRLMEQVMSAGMRPGISVNPSTPLSFLGDIDAPIVLLMSVEPGFAGQRWVPATAERVARARDLVASETTIGVDGNLTTANAALASKRGATLFVCGTSSLFGGDTDYPSAVAAVRAAAGSAAPARLGSPAASGN
jgi:ribulose-phosphate 3-epimerase